MVTSERAGRPARPPLLRAVVVCLAPLLPVALLGACTDSGTDAATVAGSTAVTSPDDPDRSGAPAEVVSGGPAPPEGGAGPEGASAPSSTADQGPGDPVPTAPTDPDDLETVAPDVRSTAARRSPPPTETISLVEVQVGQVDDSETVRFVTSGGVPGYSVRYVDAVRVEGEPVLVEGEAFVEVVLDSATPDGQEGLSPDVAVELLVDQDLVREVRFARYVDGAVTYALGLAEAAEYTVAQDDTGLTVTFRR